MINTRCGARPQEKSSRLCLTSSSFATLSVLCCSASEVHCKQTPDRGEKSEFE